MRLGRKIENKDEKQEFFSFLNDSIVFNKNAMVTGDYENFLNAYHFYVEPHKSLSVVTTGKTKEEVRIEFVTKSLNQSFEMRSGIWSEFLAASDMYSHAFREEEITQSMISTYSEIIKKKFNEPYVRQLLLAMCNKTSKKVEKITNQTIPHDAKLSQYNSISGEQLFDKILDENKGKVIYIDIWATWCSPCKQQIPHSMRMHEMLNDKNVSFVYFCCSSEKETWKNVIKQYQIKGSHILLNDKQYEYLKNKFSISGLPRYILIDKTGNIINPDAPRPDSEQIMNDMKKVIEE